MTGRIYTADHKVYDLPPLLEWQVTHTGTVPCDSFSVTFPYDGSMQQAIYLASTFSALENGNLMLRGIIDEYEIELGTDGLRATISGRGYAARLLDNESRAMTYQAVTLKDLIQNHAVPYGLTCAEVADLRGENYTVPAGTSQWKVLVDFCETWGGFQPRFLRNGNLVATPDAFPAQTLRIDERSPVLQCRLLVDHYGVLSEVLVINKQKNTSYWEKNEDWLQRGGQCRRVLYMPGSTTWETLRRTGQALLEKSRKDERIVELTLPGSFLAFPGDRVALNLPWLGVNATWKVAAAESTCSARKGTTVTLTLKECEASVAE